MHLTVPAAGDSLLLRNRGLNHAFGFCRVPGTDVENRDSRSTAARLHSPYPAAVAGASFHGSRRGIPRRSTAHGSVTERSRARLCCHVTAPFRSRLPSNAALFSGPLPAIELVIVVANLRRCCSEAIDAILCRAGVPLQRAGGRRCRPVCKSDAGQAEEIDAGLIEKGLDDGRRAPNRSAMLDSVHSYSLCLRECPRLQM